MLFGDTISIVVSERPVYCGRGVISQGHLWCSVFTPDLCVFVDGNEELMILGSGEGTRMAEDDRHPLWSRLDGSHISPRPLLYRPDRWHEARS